MIEADECRTWCPLRLLSATILLLGEELTREAGEVSSVYGGGCPVLREEELERKFIVRNVPFDLTQFPRYCIEQVYIVASDGQDERVRLATYAGRTGYYHTSKAGAGAVRSETTSTIDEERAMALLSRRELPRVVKTRHLVPYLYWDLHGALAHCCVEVDVFDIPRGQCLIAEIEFRTREAMRRFRQPDWAMEEVTDNAAYRNSSIARFGFPLSSP